MGMRITKSKFCAGVQCLKRLYLHVHQPELAAEPTAADQAIIEQGREVGMLARQMFPDGVEVRCNGGLDEAIRTTRELVANTQRPDDHIGFIPRIHASAMEELGEMGIESIRDIPDDFELTEIQRRACTSVKTGEPWFSTELGEALSGLKYPLFFMDFETVNPAIPRFVGMRPYDQLPFQWSVHVLTKPATELEHHEFLATDASDPRREFISSLCDALGESGSIVVYSSFESQRLSDLAVWLPEHAERINAIQARLFDLLPVVREHVYHPAFAGSYSIKSVLPALVPEMSYEGMQVANGQDAGLAWESLVRDSLDCSERDRIRTALLDYCGQDTLAMVRLVEMLRTLAR